ncbi:MAG: TM2 domain-containing protein [Candidatus Paceibacteria bacterium]|jgi:TM2 domain-containing membrane protein YozV
MLNQEKVDENEEELRKKIQSLDDDTKRKFYKIVKKKVKDPDTYAALNWFFITGLHHFYLGKWLMGFIDLSVLVVGILLMFLGQFELGIFLIVLISLIELWALFRSQIIIQDWNNQIQWKVINKLG